MQTDHYLVLGLSPACFEHVCYTCPMGHARPHKPEVHQIPVLRMGEFIIPLNPTGGYVVVVFTPFSNTAGELFPNKTSTRPDRV